MYACLCHGPSGRRSADRATGGPRELGPPSSSKGPPTSVSIISVWLHSISSSIIAKAFDRPADLQTCRPADLQTCRPACRRRGAQTYTLLIANWAHF